MSWKNAYKQKDYIKWKRYVKELGYDFGLYLEFGKEEISEMSWFSN